MTEAALTLVNYCCPGCTPLKNIMRLPRDEAFALAYAMAKENEGKSAFYRFADFENYYPRRKRTDGILYDGFVALGGRPRERHPLSFVLQGSEYLHRWFDDGAVTRIPLGAVPDEAVSFTYGDSCAAHTRGQALRVMTKDMLLGEIRAFGGTLEAYMEWVAGEHTYIEAQLWDDSYL